MKGIGYYVLSTPQLLTTDLLELHFHFLMSQEVDLIVRGSFGGSLEGTVLGTLKPNGSYGVHKVCVPKNTMLSVSARCTSLIKFRIFTERASHRT